MSEIHPMLKVLKEFDIENVVKDPINRAIYEEILFQYLEDIEVVNNKDDFIKRVKDFIPDKW